ncbi:hypothetical protein [Microbulbifer rhizosphaerae]|uniref:Uncharacterized protein n=1 Tax=Microbulbifer rhizosphaerae TaxID=1562603 RepID=A0A7W4Z8Z4_9GAMM|nr:hypothetical protein [Microbulbifer rhizosphaerae]MBB3061092.1 hypothetical protein [Microbulbifer rhizosphaerae]
MKDQLFNEVSAGTCYTSRQDAASAMERMSLLIQKLSEIGFSNQLRVTRDFATRTISTGYTIKNWAIDRSIDTDRDLQRNLLLAASKGPYIEDLLEDAQDDFLVEYKFQGTEVFGLGLASLWNTCTVSLDADPAFSDDSLVVSFYKADDVGEEESQINVVNLASLEHLETHRNSLRESLFLDISSGPALLEKAPLFFPSLSFGKSAQSQLMAMTGSEPYFPEIVRHLDVLNATMKDLESGAFAPRGISWSTESQPTLEMYGQRREFGCLDGEVRRFSLHSKLMAANKRIYFFPIVNEQTVHIGYVGDHLPTVRFKS